MLGIAVVGGGLSGLALARALHARRVSFCLFEARPRLGGRILSVPTADNRTRLDLGPTWYWLQSHPGLTALIDELGLENFAQHDDGTVLSLEDPDKAPTAAQIDGVHGGARRLAGGMASLIDALTTGLPADRLHLEHTLSQVCLRDNSVELRFQHSGEQVVVAAERVVLAMPPRVIAERVRFEPALDEELQAALLTTSTWMAAQAKAVIRYEHAAWRVAGQSGNALVRHEQATFTEIFDACDATGTIAALGAFVALSPPLRKDFRTGLPMLMSNQMTQLFGTGLREIEQAYHDWADEPYTCSSRDRDEFDTSGAHAGYDASALRQTVWGNRLHFGGSETAAQSPGYLEGALDAAHRIEQQLASVARGREAVDSPTAVQLPASPSRAAANAAPASPVNAASLASFARWVRSQQEPAFEGYRRHINASLAAQEREQLTQRAVLNSMEQVLDAALTQLASLPFDMQDVLVQRGCSALTPQVQSAFRGFIEQLMEDVTRFNRTSCALSNFPHEHHLSKEYEQTLLRDIAAAWREFSLAANGILLGKSIPVPPPSARTSLPPGVAS